MSLSNTGGSRLHATTLPFIPLLALKHDDNRVWQAGCESLSKITENSASSVAEGTKYSHSCTTSVPTSRQLSIVLRQQNIPDYLTMATDSPNEAILNNSINNVTTQSMTNPSEPRQNHCLVESYATGESYPRSTLDYRQDVVFGDKANTANDDMDSAAKRYGAVNIDSNNNISNMINVDNNANSINHISEVSDGDDFDYCRACEDDRSCHVNDDIESSLSLNEESLTHVGADGCVCPMCRLGGYIYYLFSHQRRASAHVIAARPSTHTSSLEKGGLLTALQSVSRPANTQVCPVFAAYDFCPYGSGCYLPHYTRRTHRIVPVRNADEELAHLQILAKQHEETDVWICNVCGYDGITEHHMDATIEFYYYRQCPRCTFMCYFPYITHLLNSILTYTGDDYQLFKDEADRYRKLVPDEFKVPLSFEAHRLATVVFAWSLFSPANAKDAIDAAYCALPEMETIVSMGAGTGYVEHVFNRVMHDVDSLPKHAIDRLRFPVSSFDEVRASFYGKKTVPIFAFDDIALRCTYSVHVSIGGPLSLLSIDCKRAVLLLCWPPFGSPQGEQSSMGFESLEYFTQRGGRIVIYIGDIVSTGDWRFHQLLHTHYKLVRGFAVRREVRRWYPQDLGLIYAGNDTYGVYERRAQPIIVPNA